jgi:hypothetical protein
MKKNENENENRKSKIGLFLKRIRIIGIIGKNITIQGEIIE